MTLLINLIKHYARSFEDDKYPTEVYYHLLDQVSRASTCQEMGSALVHLAHWKAGCVKRDPAGKYVATPSGMRYTVLPISTKYGNTLTDVHVAILMSESFFTWAKTVRLLKHFDAVYIQQLHEMGLWTTVVMPVFILHGLQPRVFPIYDIMVLFAHDLLTGDPDGTQPRDIGRTTTRYVAYQAWWLDVLAEAGIGPMSAQLNQLKEIDAGLWALGRQAKKLAAIEHNDLEAPETEGQPAQSTDSEQFKRRAVELRGRGLTQLNAIVTAAAELGIELKPSYLKYPGSHFDRWRKQGLA